MESFYDLRHQTIYSILAEMSEKREAIDIITVQERLKDKGLLEQVGGIGYLSTLPDKVPSAANLTYYLKILLEKYELRRIARGCTEITRRAYDCQGDAAELVEAVRADLGALSRPGSGTEARLEERRYNPDIEPPSLRAIYSLHGTPICTPANITTITAAIKSGKSAVIGAMAAACMPHPPDADCLGFNAANEKGRALLWSTPTLAG